MKKLEYIVPFLTLYKWFYPESRIQLSKDNQVLEQGTGSFNRPHGNPLLAMLGYMSCAKLEHNMKKLYCISSSQGFFFGHFLLVLIFNLLALNIIRLPPVVLLIVFHTLLVTPFPH